LKIYIEPVQKILAIGTSLAITQHQVEIELLTVHLSIFMKEIMLERIKF
jgi:hypothetical protein